MIIHVEQMLHLIVLLQLVIIHFNVAVKMGLLGIKLKQFVLVIVMLLLINIGILILKNVRLVPKILIKLNGMLLIMFVELIVHCILELRRLLVILLIVTVGLELLGMLLIFYVLHHLQDYY